ncbi:MAG: DEAD/DEAH box helicase family protein [Methanomassiliicoccales archaeon]|nr:MAG: DEAD/DEAH box helicase family protein [Methanomassiliicoccales archaeon]
MNSPEVGMNVLVRKRPAIVRQVKTFTDASTSEQMHLVDVDYFDGHDFPEEDQIVWEREVNAQLFSFQDVPEIKTPRNQPDPPEKFQAFIDSLKWTSNTSYFLNNERLQSRSLSVLSPWFSSVQVEDYQLYPVLKAMAMPRVNMLLADDVGLGKTIEAGLILQELIRQRRIRRIMIICPASLQIQWQDEMREKFHLDFEIMDSDKVFQVQKELGIDLNPWTAFPRIITSMDYLKQKYVLSSFSNGSQNLLPKDSSLLPWDMLIVDEAHNFMPSSLNDQSDRVSMLRQVAPFFEHRLFLTATPHNGHTESFTGLLELLDPVRFHQKTKLNEEDHKQIGLVMIRRMKSQLNQDKKRFTSRSLTAIPVIMDQKEVRLYDAMARYRSMGTRELGRLGRKEKALGGFILQLLTKRLLSSSYAFARSWWNHVDGFDLEEFDREQAEESRKRAEQPVDEDQEKEQREEDAVRHGAAWLKRYKAVLDQYIGPVSKALEELGWTRENTIQMANVKHLPIDSRWEQLKKWIEKNLMVEGKVRGDERLIIFTEYKDTQDYLVKRLNQMGFKEPVLQLLYGGADANQRRLVKEEFNEPSSQLRVLVATDAASEGLNLQTSCRYVIHQEIPWNPMRLEQRNGRVDRHGQVRDVVVHHFVSDQSEDLLFLDKVVRKVHNVREDLGSMGKVLDEAVLEYFTNGNVDEKKIEEKLGKVKKDGQDKEDISFSSKGTETEYSVAMKMFEETREILGIGEGGIARLLDQAIVLDKADKGEIRKEGEGFYRFYKIPLKWQKLVEGSLLIKSHQGVGYPKICFDPSRMVTIENGLNFFRQPKDTRLLMLSHPLMERALLSFKRRLWMPSNDSGLSRWTIIEGKVPRSIIAFNVFFLITATNKLGERARTGIFKETMVMGDSGPLNTAKEISTFPDKIERSKLERYLPEVRSKWIKVESALEIRKKEIAKQIASLTEEELRRERSLRSKEYQELFELRKRSLMERTDPKNIEKLLDELKEAEERWRQQTLFEDINEERRLEYEIKRQEYEELRSETGRKNIEVMLEKLNRERERMLERVLPNRYSLVENGVDVQVAGVEVILPKEATE